MTLEVNLSGNGDIDGILHGWKWDTTASRLIYWEVPVGTAEYIDNDADPVQTGYMPGSIVGFTPFSTVQRDTIGLALANVASFADLIFFRLDGPPDPLANYAADFRYAMATTIDYTNNGTGVHVPGRTDTTPPGTAEGNWPQLPGTFNQGDAWFNTTSYNSPAPGNYAYTAGLMHETGHLLGLKHGHVTQDAHGSTFPTLPADHDSQEYSIMTYRQFPGNPILPLGFNNFDFPTTFMQDDIAALQYMYGANFGLSANNSTTTYTWSPTTGEESINGVAQGAPYRNFVFMTVWDGGGFDEYNFSNYTTNLKVDLNPGAWTILDTSPTMAQRADLGNNGSGGAEYFARGNIANAQLYNGDTRSLIEKATGGSGNDYLIGNSANNVLDGGPGSDILDGRGGADLMYGGTGDDCYEVDNPGDTVGEFANEGIDRFDSYISIDALPANVENIVLYGTGDLYAIANGLANAINGTNGNNGLYGLDGDDEIYGYGGADWIDGGAGNDRMVGGSGNDTYQVDSALDVVVENANEGTDQVNSYLSYTLGANIENLVLYGSTNLNGTGNALANVINGNFGVNTLHGLAGNDYLLGYAGADTLDGGTGADILDGGADNDRYYVDNAGDQVIEAAGGGTDTVYSSITYTLALNVENLTLTGNNNINGTGNALANTLRGNIGNNILDGRAGADTMIGGAGNDTYLVDDPGDVATELAGEGTDTVQARITYTLGANVENLTLTGNNNINGTGNALANTLRGNIGNNILDGRAGADTMIGGTGNDTYYVDNAGDVVTELVGEGTDTVQSSITYTLGANVENLTLTGNNNINGTGNAFANTLRGNIGNNILDGRAGADTMIGSAGNDTFVVDDPGDVVTELAGEGTDIVQARITYTLGANVENLTLTGNNPINGTGNALANQIGGNVGNNVIDGMLGNDTLSGGGGINSFLFDTSLASNVDTIVDFNVANDTMRLDKDVFTAFTTTGTLAASAFQIGASAADAADRIIYNMATGNLFYDSDGTGAAAQVQFAHVNGTPALTNTDFLIAA